MNFFDPIAMLELALIGVAAGFGAGLLGIGGGTVIVPLLLAILTRRGVAPEVVMHITIGTSLGSVCVSAVSAAYTHWRKGNVDPRDVPPLVVASVTGAVLASGIAAALSGELLRRAFGVFMILTGLRMMVPARGARAGEADAGRKTDFKTLGAIGGTAGLLSAFFGVGGGVIAVPMLTGLARFPIHRALGTSSAMIIFTAVAGIASYVWNGWGAPGLPEGAVGYFLPSAWLLIVAASFPSAWVGAHAAGRISPARLRLVFGVFILAVGVKLAAFS